MEERSRAQELKRRKLEGEDEEGSYNIDENMDQLLNLEEQYYEEGYREGQEESTRLQYIEGKEYGYQTGFQRFLVVGYIKGLIEYWESHLESYGSSKSISGHINQIKGVIDNIPLKNDDEAVALYEKSINKIRNKVRIVGTITKELYKVSQLDDIIKEVGGNLQVSENVDDMW